MKNETFEIKANGIVFDTRSKWNASIRSIEAKVREIAKPKTPFTNFVAAKVEKKLLACIDEASKTSYRIHIPTKNRKREKCTNGKTK